MTKPQTTIAESSPAAARRASDFGLPSSFVLRPSSFPAPRGFTLVELMMAMAIGSVVVGAALAGIIGLQRAYAATEQYATNLADQTRLLDCLGMDLRRARQVTFDADCNGMTVTLPDFYNYGTADLQRIAPLPNTPQVPSDHSRAIYTSAGGNVDDYANLPAPAVYYHFDSVTKNITREELPPALPANRVPTNRPPVTAASVYGQRVVASSLQGFPQIQLRDDAGNAIGALNTSASNGQDPLQVSITVCFQPIFRTVSTPDTNLIRLHGRVLLRNNDLRSR